MARGNTITGSTIWNLDSSGISGVFAKHIDRLGEAVSHGDYNDDGIQDLAIGIPNYDSFFSGVSFTNSGTVLIIYGSPNGLSSANHQFLYQTLETGSPFLENLNGVEANDFFGKSLASGDFNCDGITDLAVGSPEESVTINGEFRNAVGAVNIFYGQLGGFNFLSEGLTFLLQSTILSNIEADDRFGWSMAVGNFNEDIVILHECQDLAVSAPFEGFSLITNNAGSVAVFYGEASGLSHLNKDVLAQVDLNISGEAQSGDQFGYSLAAGNFSQNLASSQFSALVVGVPGEDVNNKVNAGAVQVFQGSADGLKANVDDFFWSQAGAVSGGVEANDRFGTSLTVGDFNQDQIEDLVIGVPHEDLNVTGINDAGAVVIIYGSITGLSSSGSQSFHQDSLNIAGEPENSGRFGDFITIGDLNGDSIDDLVIGVPRENNSKGAFHILFGSPGGLITVDSIFEKNLGDGEALDEMGYAMTIANFGNGNELVVGISGDDSVSGFNDAGSVEVFEFPQPLPDLIFAGSFEG